MASSAGLRRRAVAGAGAPPQVAVEKRRLTDAEAVAPKRWRWFLIALMALLLCRALAAAANPVHDCDEVFNYWEPLHYALHGRGLQTWEYSADFGLRSFLYIRAHAWAAAPGAAAVRAARAAMGLAPLAARAEEFYAVRALLVLISSLSDAWLASSTACAAGPRAAAVFILVSASAAGTLAQAPALLPSSAVASCVSCAVAAAIDARPRRALVIASFGCVAAGWPFAGIAMVPLGLWGCASVGIRPAVLWTLSAAALALVLGAWADRGHYERWVLAPLNLVRYNFAGGDSTLYGVEPFHFYWKNLLLNFAPAVVVPLFGAFFSACNALSARRVECSARSRAWYLALATTWTWLSVLSLVPHKEERFLTPVYPTLVLAAALGWDSFLRILSAARVAPGRILDCIAWVVLLASAALGLSRYAALAANYGAPLDVYARLPSARAGGELLCVGDEWHRFPSSFFLPDGYEVAWVRESGGGMLPMPFEADNPAPAHFNDRNVESPEQYVPLEKCTVLVDAKAEGAGGLTDSAGGRWSTVAEADFVDRTRSPFLTRVFYLPTAMQDLTGVRNAHVKYTAKRRE